MEQQVQHCPFCGQEAKTDNGFRKHLVARHGATK